MTLSSDDWRMSRKHLRDGQQYAQERTLEFRDQFWAAIEHDGTDESPESHGETNE